MTSALRGQRWPLVLELMAEMRRRQMGDLSFVSPIYGYCSRDNDDETMNLGVFSDKPFATVTKQLMTTGKRPFVTCMGRR